MLSVGYISGIYSKRGLRSISTRKLSKTSVIFRGRLDARLLSIGINYSSKISSLKILLSSFFLRMHIAFSIRLRYALHECTVCPRVCWLSFAGWSSDLKYVFSRLFLPTLTASWSLVSPFSHFFSFFFFSIFVFKLQTI